MQWKPEDNEGLWLCDKRHTSYCLCSTCGRAQGWNPRLALLKWMCHILVGWISSQTGTEVDVSRIPRSMLTFKQVHLMFSIMLQLLKPKRNIVSDPNWSPLWPGAERQSIWTCRWYFCPRGRRAYGAPCSECHSELGLLWHAWLTAISAEPYSPKLSSVLARTHLGFRRLSAAHTASVHLWCILLEGRRYI